ncbi:MAG: nucleoside deaminase [Endomicrobiaceae bacterium]|nr:nucleoside deaminase [Endomicrobiaceae bacterium]
MDTKQKHKLFLEKVISLAIKNVKINNGGPFVAAIIKNDKIISCGYNQVTKKNDPTLHAEIDAIRKASKKLKTFDLTGCVIYSSCEPCPMCFSAIHWANIKKIYYGATKETVSKYGFRDLKIYKELKTGKFSIKQKKINIDSEIEPFKIWNRKKDKIKY